MVDIARTSAFRYALGYVDGLAREYGVDREELRAMHKGTAADCMASRAHLTF